MKIAEAKRQLEGWGYHVEYTSGNANVYVRKQVNSHPVTMRSRNGEVSDRTVERLCKAMLS